MRISSKGHFLLLLPLACALLFALVLPSLRNYVPDSLSSRPSQNARSDQELPAVAVQPEPQVLWDVGPGCTVSSESLNSLATWLEAQFWNGDNLGEIKKKMASRGQLVEVIALGGSGAKEAVFVTDEVKISFYLDVTDRLQSPVFMVIRCNK